VISQWLRKTREWVVYLHPCRREPVRVTFDTNALDRVVRPERYPKDLRQHAFKKIHKALKDGRIKGFFSETVLTLEGIQKIDRADVFDSTKILTDIKEEKAANGESGRVKVVLTALQPARRQLHPEVVKRIRSAIQLGLRGMKIPRNGMIDIEDPSGKFFVQQSETEMAQRQQKTFEAARAIEKRNVGMTKVRQLGAKFGSRDGVSEPWYRSLVRAKDVHEENQVKRAISEWADGDSIAAHIGYGNEFFCTEDKGRTGGVSSIFDEKNRVWLAETYGVRFVTLPELAEQLTCSWKSLLSSVFSR